MPVNYVLQSSGHAYMLVLVKGMVQQRPACQAMLPEDCFIPGCCCLFSCRVQAQGALTIRLTYTVTGRLQQSKHKAAKQFGEASQQAQTDTVPSTCFGTGIDFSAYGMLKLSVVFHVNEGCCVQPLYTHTYV